MGTAIKMSHKKKGQTWKKHEGGKNGEDWLQYKPYEVETPEE
jgi:hypothetical protein